MQNLMKCQSCGCANVETRIGQTYHFKESGLDNVFLINVETTHCPTCGAETVSIPAPTELLSCLGELVVLSPSRLIGPEVRFLRKNLHMKITDFAKLLGVARGTVSRWENGRVKVTKPEDRLIRLIYLSRASVRDKVKSEFQKRLEKDDAKRHGGYRLPIDQLSYTHQGQLC